MDSYIFLLDDCGLYVLLTVSILFFAIEGVMSYFTTLGFVLMSAFPSLTLFSLVETNDVLEDMILVIDLLFPF